MAGCSASLSRAAKYARIPAWIVLPLLILGVHAIDASAQDAYEPDDTQGQASAAWSISPGYESLTPPRYEQINHSIHALGDEDWLQFELTAAALVLLETGGTPNDDPLLTLYDSSLEELATDDNSGAWGKHPRLYIFLAAGTYFVRITESGNNATIADYFVILWPFIPDSREVDNDAASSTPLTPTSLIGNLIPAGDEDWFQVTIAQQSEIRLNCDYETLQVAGDPYIELYDSGLLLLATHTTVTPAPFFPSNQLEAAVMPGTYYVRIHGPASLPTPSYRLTCLLYNDGPYEYEFVRSFPTLQQPWYFPRPMSFASDPTGNAYVVDEISDQVIKMTSDGQFIARWGGYGTAPGNLNNPKGACADSQGNIFVVDQGNSRIQKFSANGAYITAWGNNGPGPGQFGYARTAAVDSEDNVYVLDMGYPRVQKFDSEGGFITEWASPAGRDLAIDKRDIVYVAEENNHRIARYDGDGNLLGYWEQGPWYEVPVPARDWEPMFVSYSLVHDLIVIFMFGPGDSLYVFQPDGTFVNSWRVGEGGGRFPEEPWIMEVTPSGEVVIGDGRHHSLQFFTTGGTFTRPWGSSGTGEGVFSRPYDLAVGDSGVIYVSEYGNNRVQKLSSNGAHLGEWSISRPWGVSFAPTGALWVASGSQISEYSTGGTLLQSWGQWGSNDDDLYQPQGIAVDDSGVVYVADTHNHHVKKFTSAGVFLDKVLVGSPEDVAIGDDGNIYASNALGLYKYSSDLDLLNEIRFHGMRVHGIAATSGGDLFVVIQNETGHNPASDARVVVLDSDGVIMNEFGAYGFEPGQFQEPWGVAVSADGTLIYVADTGNDRIQVFRRTLTPASSRAIIVAAGGPFSGNNLWDSTQLCANFAYRTLTYQGFTKDRIQYLSSDLDLDLDGNGVADDVDADATNANLEDAITSWATSGGTEDVVVYLVDHGGVGNFRMSGTETLAASALDGWLDTLEGSITGTLTVVYDACESGTFQSALAPTAGQQRIVVTSTSPGESAYFLSQGTVSFSVFFWTHVFNGATVLEAFDLAKAGMNQTLVSQSPLLVDSPADQSLAAATYLGNGTEIVGDAPVIGDQSAPQSISGTSTATVFADPVTDADGIARVWAVVQPPDFAPTSTTNPVQDLPNFDLQPLGNDRYEATWPGFTSTGLYQVAIYARDRIGNTSSPVLTTVSVDSPLRRKAIICIGGTQSHPQWDAYENAAGRAYSALRQQQYSDADIAFRSPVTFNAGVDGAPSLSNLNYLITTWGTFDTYDLVLYLVGPSSSGSFELGTGEFLDPVTLDGWLDILQTTIPGKVTIIVDANQSGSFVPGLLPPSGKQRIVCASAGGAETSRFGAGGDVSFSAYFWNQVLNGVKVRNAFKHAQNAMRFSGDGQFAVINDNGNDVGNEKLDGIIAKDYAIGAGIQLAGDAPVIGSIGATLDTLSGATSALIWVDGVTSTGTIDSVTATVLPPGYEEGDVLDEFTLSYVSGNRYEGTYSSFDVFGTYEVAVVARDTDGQASAPLSTTVTQTDAADAYEEDDSAGSATWFDLDGPSQTHNFHDAGDADWVRFSAQAGDVVTLETFNLGSASDTLITLYEGDATTVIDQSDDDSVPELLASYLEFTASTSDYYYLKIEFSPLGSPPTFGANSEYSLRIFRPIGACIEAGNLYIYVHEESVSGPGLSGAAVSLAHTDSLDTPQDKPSGVGGETHFGFSHAGKHRITVSLAGYTMVPHPDVSLTCGQSLGVDVVLQEDAGVDPALQVMPGGWEYGQVAVGDYLEKVFTLTNSGGGTVAGNASTLSPFSIVAGGSYSIDAGQNHNVTVRFTPGAAQGYNGQLTLSGGGGKTAALSGTGFSAASGVIGDVNTDGSVDAFDGTLISLYVAYGADESALTTINGALLGLGLNEMVSGLTDVDRTSGATGRDAALINAQLLMGKTALNGYLSTRSPALPVSHAGEPLP